MKTNRLLLLMISSIKSLSIKNTETQKLGLNSEIVDGLEFSDIIRSQREKNSELDDESLKLLFFTMMCYGSASESDLIGEVVIGLTGDNDKILISQYKLKALADLVIGFRSDNEYSRTRLRPIYYYYSISLAENQIIAYVLDSEKIIMTNNTEYFNRIFESFKDNFDDELQGLIVKKRFYINRNLKVSPLEFLGGRLISLALHLE